MTTRRHALVTVAAAASLVMTACAGGGASDTVGAAAAAEWGALALPARPPAFDLGRVDPARRDAQAGLAAWLAMEVPQGSPTPPAS